MVLDFLHPLLRQLDISCHLRLHMLPSAWQAAWGKLAVSLAPSKRLRCQIAATLTVKGRVLIMPIPSRSICLHPRELHILSL